MPKCYVPNYPRPQFVRDNWIDLCGKWSFRFDDEKSGYEQGWFKGFTDQEILVPFTYETKMSGINKEEHHECVWYSRTFDVKDNSSHMLLHFEGSDYTTYVWINGQLVGTHDGGYARFSFDISKYLINGENNLTVRCEDSMDRRRPRGKQRWIKENFGCWYVQTTGIWKQVWLETVPCVRLDNVKITPDYDNYSVKLDYSLNKQSDNCAVEARVLFEDELIAVQTTHMSKVNKSTVVDLTSDNMEWDVKLWSPNEPNLYDIEFKVINGGETVDTVGSYFGLRKISIDGDKVLLNNTPLYQKLILDQGYWPESGMTPPSEEALIEDIDKIMELGFNGLRKHQKTEDERFAYWCDVKGMLLWCEAPSYYCFDDLAVDRFTKEWIEIVRQNYNHPSIVAWTPFNESWGVARIRNNIEQQDFTVGIYHLTKAIDSMRPVITNDGWEHTCSDIITLHNYEQDAEKFFSVFEDEGKVLFDDPAMIDTRFTFAEGWEYKGQPVIISEYGGIAIAGRGEGWGYGNRVADEKGLIERYTALTNAIFDLDYVSGFCYTQVTDVEQEVNGLMDTKRNFKCDVKAIRKANSQK